MTCLSSCSILKAIINLRSFSQTLDPLSTICCYAHALIGVVD
jgi:hypothetical protein